MTVEGWDGSKATEEQLPSSDDVANSMFGGSKELFEQTPHTSSRETNIPPLPSLTIPETPVIPTLPENGLPEGWTMEQWQHYGQRWLDSQKDE